MQQHVLAVTLAKDRTAGFSDTFLKPPRLYKIMVSAAHKDTRENWNSQGSKKKSTWKKRQCFKQNAQRRQHFPQLWDIQHKRNFP